jgi:hypothetical protein
MKTDKAAVGMGAVSQLRVMGGAIVLAIATSVFNSYTRPRLAGFFESAQSSGNPISSMQSLAQFSSEEQASIKAILANGYNLQMYVLCAFAAAQIPSALLLWRKKQILV